MLPEDFQLFIILEFIKMVFFWFQVQLRVLHSPNRQFYIRKLLFTQVPRPFVCRNELRRLLGCTFLFECNYECLETCFQFSRFDLAVCQQNDKALTTHYSTYFLFIVAWLPEN